MLFAIIFTLLIILILLTPWFDNPDGQLTKYHLIIAIGAVYLVISIMTVSYTHLTLPTTGHGCCYRGGAADY